MTRTQKVVFITCLLPLLLEPLGKLLASGGGYEITVFVRTAHPDSPLENFVAGKLGVVEPTYWRRDLVIAYRYLSGRPLTAAERESLRPYWEKKAPFSAGAGNLAQALSPEEVTQKWLEARGRVPGVKPLDHIHPYREGIDAARGFYFYLNCPDDAFRNAAATLTRRIGEYGASSPTVHDWVEAQDRVFANCNARGGTPQLKPAWTPPGQADQTTLGGVIPEPAPAGAPAEIKADRAYQIAAANFYAGNFEIAEQQFWQIARDASSPWHTLAPYLAARSLVRKGTLAKALGFDPAPLLEAESRLKRMASDPAFAGINSEANGLLGFVEWRLHPDQVVHPLAERLEKAGASRNFYQDLIDYTLSFAKIQDTLPSGTPDPGAPPYEAFQRSGDDLTDWLITFHDPGVDAEHHARDWWQATHSPAWLVAGISKATPGDPDAAKLGAAAEQIPPDSPAYLTVTYHRFRLELGAGRQDEVRAQLDRLLAARDWKDQPSASNLFRAQRQTLARSFNEFLTYAPRAIAGYAYSAMPDAYFLDQPSGGNLAQAADMPTVLFDDDAARVFNLSLPLSLITQAATAKTLPAHLRRRLAMAAWTRAFVLGDDSTAATLIPTLRDTVPELKPYLDRYATAASPAARHQEGAWMLLKSPGLRPYVEAGLGRQEPLGERDMMRDNWWCEIGPQTQFDIPLSWQRSVSQPAEPGAPVPTRPLAPFLTPEQQATARAELARLQAAGVATDFLSRQVMDWAKQQPDDSRIPEALSIVVILPHAGCTTDQTGSFSHAAFDLLHSRYGSTTWAKQTRYWYK